MDFNKPEEDDKHEVKDDLPFKDKFKEEIEEPMSKEETFIKEKSIEENPAPLNSPQSTDNMEVHHHSHAHKGKTWKEYLFEFFMLFLAVFCGFLAEYMLEHKIERDREKQFMVSMIEDLKSDKTLLDENIIIRQHQVILIDSLILILSNSNFTEYGNQIYYIGRSVTIPSIFVPNDRTIQQLKFAGGLRLVRNLSVSDSIMFYYQQMQWVSLALDDEMRARQDFRAFAPTIFDGKIFFEMQDKNLGRTINRPSGNPQLLKNDAGSINQIIVRAAYLKSIAMALINREEILRDVATNLMRFIENEYHVERE